MSDNAPGDVFSPNQTYKSHRRWEDQLGNEVYVVRRWHVKCYTCATVMAFDTDQDLEAISTKTRYSYSVMPLDNKTKVPVCRSCLPEWEHYKKSLEIWQQHLNDNRKKWWEIFKTPMKLPRPSPPRRR